MKERKFEVLYRDNKGVNITIAKERTTVKFPPGLDAQQEADIIQFVKRIEDEVRDKFDKTMRGKMEWDEKYQRFCSLTLFSVSRKEKIKLYVKERKHE